MARIYAALIRKGIKTLEDVPTRPAEGCRGSAAAGGRPCLTFTPAQGMAKRC